MIANLSEDENKLNIFLLGVDGHSLAACFYWPQEVEAQIGYIEDASERALKFKEEMDKGNTALKELRNRGKRISFGLGKAGLSYSNVRVIKKSNSVKPKSL